MSKKHNRWHGLFLGVCAVACSTSWAVASAESLSSAAPSSSLLTERAVTSLQQDNTKQRIITGTVLDEQGNPLPGAMIRLKGVAGGTSSRADGSFRITIPAGHKDPTIEVSFVGMVKRSIKVTAKTPATLRVTLKEDKSELGEVIVTSYQKLKKNSFTGNATIVSKDQLLKTNNKNAIAALQHFEPSLRIKESMAWGSDPNRMPDFTLRGESSLGTSRGLDTEINRRTQRTGLADNPNLPIFILDGFPVSVQKIIDLDMNLIESMVVLKDAAATALYGSRASNGVIIVTTIPPQAGKIRVNYNATAGIELPDLSDYNLANAEEMLQIEYFAGLFKSDDKGVQVDKDIAYNKLYNEVRRGVRTDWLAQPLRNAFNQQHSVYISGGVESIRYGVDFNFNTHNGAMKGSYRNNFGAGLTLDYRLGEWLQILNKVSYNMTKSEDSPYGNFEQYARLKPYWAPYDNDGNLLDVVYGHTNPMYKAKYLGSYTGRGNWGDITNNLSLNLYITKNLSFKSQFSVSKIDNMTESFSDPKDPQYRGALSEKKGALSRNFGDQVNWNLNSTLNFNKSIQKHFINLMAGLNASETNSWDMTTNYTGFQLSNLNSPRYAALQDGKTPQNFAQTRLFGVLAGLNYTYDEKYLFDASFRLDGSSKFGSKRRFAPFWSTGVGINVHKYEFMKQQDVISNLRLRATYGVTGNVSFPAYAAISTYRTAAEWYTSTPANQLIALGNPNLTWERTSTLDMGIQVGLWRDRLSIDFNYYNRETFDQLSQLNIRTSSGFSTYYTNAGSIRNRGYELRLNTVPYQDENWRVAINATMAANQNRITSLGQDAELYNKGIQNFHDGLTQAKGISKEDAEKLLYSPLTQFNVGASTTAIYAVQSLGIDPSTGRELFMKRSGLPSQIWNAADQIVVGDRSPKAQGSFSINVGWKGFYINASFMYQFGAQQYNETLLHKVENADIENSNVDRRVLTERWQKPGDLTPYYDLKMKTLTKPTSRFVQDDNYLAFSSLSGGYDFHPDVARKLYLTSLGIRFNANDIVRWSTIRQERGTSYPYAKNYSFTLTLGF